jgi:tetratricopeptide (TPR) repeat protein
MNKNKSIQFKVKLLLSKEDGNKFFQNEQYEQAISCYTKAVELDDSNPIFFSNSSNMLNIGSACYLALSMYNEALDDALNCLKIDKTYMKVKRK